MANLSYNPAIKNESSVFHWQVFFDITIDGSPAGRIVIGVSENTYVPCIAIILLWLNVLASP